jgi:hypothetical protein
MWVRENKKNQKQVYIYYTWNGRYVQSTPAQYSSSTHRGGRLLKKKIGHNFPRIIEVFTQKIVTKPSKIWVWYPGSEIRDPEKTYSGSRGQKGTGSRIPDPQHWPEMGG